MGNKNKKKNRLEVEYEISHGEDGKLWILTFICKERVSKAEFQSILYKLIVEEDFEEVEHGEIQ